MTVPSHVKADIAAAIAASKATGHAQHIRTDGIPITARPTSEQWSLESAWAFLKSRERIEPPRAVIKRGVQTGDNTWSIVQVPS